MGNTNELKWGSILSYAQMALSIIIGIVYTPIMIRTLGQSEYGLYNTIASTISMLSILSLGFNSSYVRYYARYKKENDKERIYQLNGLFLVIFTVIGVVALICGLFLTTHLELVFDQGLSIEEYATARVLMLLLTINLTITFPMSVFSTIISANERFLFLKLLGMVRTILGPMVNLPLLLMGFRSVGLVVSSLVFGLITDGVYIYYVTIKLRNRFIFGRVEGGLIKSLFTYTLFIAINMIVDQINNNIDRVLLGRFTGTISVAVYAVGANLYTYYTSISMAVSGVFTPRIHQTYIAYRDEQTRDRELTNLFIKVGRIQFLILMLIASGMVVFGKDFIRFWVGNGYEESYYVILLLMLPASIPLIQNLGIEIQRAADKHKFRSIVYLVMAICNLIMTIYLCQRYGAVGAAIGTGVSYILANGLLMNWYYIRKMGIDILQFWKNILRIALGMLPAFAVGAAIMICVSFPTVWYMLVFILLYTTVYVSCVWLFSMNSFEKDLIAKPVNKVLKKINERIKG